MPGRGLTVVEKVRAIGAESFPITTWRSAARLLGVSEDTLARKRSAVNDETPPYFPNKDAVRAWYAELLAPSSQRHRRRAERRVGEPVVVDWNAAARGR